MTISVARARAFAVISIVFSVICTVAVFALSPVAILPVLMGIPAVIIAFRRSMRRLGVVAAVWSLVPIGQVLMDMGSRIEGLVFAPALCGLLVTSAVFIDFATRRSPVPL
jgi:hypothetical protein